MNYQIYATVQSWGKRCPAAAVVHRRQLARHCSPAPAGSRAGGSMRAKAGCAPTRAGGRTDLQPPLSRLASQVHPWTSPAGAEHPWVDLSRTPLKTIMSPFLQLPFGGLCRTGPEVVAGAPARGPNRAGAARARGAGRTPPRGSGGSVRRRRPPDVLNLASAPMVGAFPEKSQALCPLPPTLSRRTSTRAAGGAGGPLPTPRAPCPLCGRPPVRRLPPGSHPGCFL